MKKRNLTMGKKNGIYGLGLLVFLVICGSQDVLALSDISNSVTLNVNAATQVAPALTNGKVNQFTYYTAAGLLQNVSTGWAEKTVYGSVVTAPSTTSATVPLPAAAEVKVAVTVKAPNRTTIKGDLIVKVDQVTVTTNSAIGATVGSGLIVQSYWLKYAYTPGPFNTTASAITLVANLGFPIGDPVQVDNSILSTLCLAKDMTLTTDGTTITLLDFTTKSKMSSQIVFTAVLIDSTVLADGTENPYPQVMGVDIKTIFFNYVDPTTPKTTYRPIWLDIVMAGDSLSWLAMPLQ